MTLRAWKPLPPPIYCTEGCGRRSTGGRCQSCASTQSAKWRKRRGKKVTAKSVANTLNLQAYHCGMDDRHIMRAQVDADGVYLRCPLCGWQMSYVPYEKNR